MRKIDRIIIHCSDSPPGTTAAEIDDWHRGRGWKRIGYHYVIEEDGSVRTGRKISEVGAHVQGKNRNSIGICLTGVRGFNKEQMQSLVILCNGLIAMFRPEKVQVQGHYEAQTKTHKTCPNMDMDEVRRMIVLGKPI